MAITTITPEKRFRFWCQKVLPLVYDDSLSYYELLCKVVKHLNTTLENVNTLNENVNTLSADLAEVEQQLKDFENSDAVQDAIAEKLQEMYEDGKFSSYILQLREMTANVLAEYSCAQTPAESGIGGMCYAGCGKYVFCTRVSEGVDQNMLICIDIRTYTVLWKHKLQLYHGNSVCFNPETRKLYVASCFDHAKVITPYILKIDFDNPGVIEEVITQPVSGYSAGSVAYDSVTGKYYMKGATTTTSPIDYTKGSGKLFVFSDDFRTLEKTVDLEYNVNTAMMVNGSQQEIDVRNGILYDMRYFNQNLVCLWNADTGAYIACANIPKHMNAYKVIHESEGITYDWDRDRWVMLGVTQTGFAHGCPCATLFDIGLYKDIPIQDIKYAGSYGPFAKSITWEETHVDTGFGSCVGDSVLPVMKQTPATKFFRSMYDAEYYGSLFGHGRMIQYVLHDTSNNAPYVSNMHFSHSFRIQPVDDGVTELTLSNVSIRNVEHAVFFDCTITGDGQVDNATLGTSQDINGETVYIGPAIMYCSFGNHVTLRNVIFRIPRTEYDASNPSSIKYRNLRYGIAVLGEGEVKFVTDDRTNGKGADCDRENGRANSITVYYYSNAIGTYLFNTSRLVGVANPSVAAAAGDYYIETAGNRNTTVITNINA